MEAQGVGSFQPKYAHRPGAYLERVLEERGIKKVDFATRCGRPTKTISEIISGVTAVTPETAIQFEHVLNIPAQQWLNMEARYRLHKAKTEEVESLSESKGWAELLPIKELHKRGYIEKHSDWAETVRELLGFFGVGSVEAWGGFWKERREATAFRKTAKFKTDEYALAAWLRIGEILARDIETHIYEPKLFRQSLNEVRALTIAGENRDTFEPKLRSICAKAGVAVVVVPEIKGARVSGAARWVSKDKPLIQLSTRYKLDDQFWFSFFHEAGHILLHSKKKTFIDEDDGVGKNEEFEANQFAENILMPQHLWKEFYVRYPKDGPKKRYTYANVKEFAEYAGISPGILAAQIIRKVPNLRNSKLNKLKINIDPKAVQ